jgi:hypothetical protein
MHEASLRLATVAYFSAKQNVCGLLSSLLIQPRVQSDSFCEVFYALYSTPDQVSGQPKAMMCSDNNELKGPIHIVIDALDESMNTQIPPVCRIRRANRSSSLSFSQTQGCGSGQQQFRDPIPINTLAENGDRTLSQRFRALMMLAYVTT